ncbi:MAG: caspase family protein [Ferruginibacter sp.]
MKAQSLLIGLNNVDPSCYNGWDGHLAVCENDASSMEKKLKASRYETTLLKTAEATRNAVLDAIDKAAAVLKTGDSFVLYYSGHGSQVPDTNRKKIVDGGDEADGMDETWCLYDGQLIDDILFQRWFKFKAGVKIIVVSDSCHSGSVIKNTPTGFKPGNDPGLVYKIMPPQVAVAVYESHQKEYTAFNKKECPLRSSKTKKILKTDIKATVLLMSGCQDKQLSQAQTFSFPDNSLFTAMMLQLLEKKKPPTSYASLVKAVRDKMPADQQPNLMTLGKKPEALEIQKPFKP